MIWALAPLVVSNLLRQPTFTDPSRIRYDGHCFTIEGKDLFLYSGAFHYFRCPRELWRERFKKIKEAGFNAVETYVAWNWSEQKPPSGPDDYHNVNLKDLDDWLSMAENEFGLYTIVRPGPYICSEWASGGFPNWLPTFRPAHTAQPMWYRSDDPEFERWSRHWYTEVAAVVAKHQLTHKAKGAHGVILWQVENEYDFDEHSDEVKRAYVKYLIQTTKDLGIDVPIFTCWTRPVRFPKGDPILSQAFDNPNEYPSWNIEGASQGIRDQHEAEPWAPKMVTEFQGGWFGGVGAQAAEEQEGIDDRQTKALTIWSIANGLTGLNYYMLFGGTNFGDWAAEGITTSYDYYAPIREWGGGGAKYRVVKAIGGFLAKYGPDLARSDSVPAPKLETSYGQIKLLARKGSNGATYLFIWNPDTRNPAQGLLDGVLQVSLTPFGAEIYRYSGAIGSGSWCTLTPPTPAQIAGPSIQIQTAEAAELTPAGWRDVDPANPTTAALGVWDSRFLAYRLTIANGSPKYAWLGAAETDLAGEKPPVSSPFRGANSWPIHAGDNDFLAFNKGWPNGGRGMEQPHGIQAVKLLTDMPSANVLGSWRTKMLEDQADRSLAVVGVDTADWVEGTGTKLFLPHTTGVLRTSFNFNPTGNQVTLSCGGVDDEGWFYLNGKLVGEVHQYNVPLEMDVTSAIKPGRNEVAIVIQNNDGPGGLTGEVAVYEPVPESPTPKPRLHWTDRFLPGVHSTYSLETEPNLPEIEHPHLSGTRPPAQHLVRSTLRFDLPTTDHVWEIVLKAGGDGFLTLNGHPLGRYWEVGPQRAYFLPRPWLKPQNVLELTALPGQLGDRITAAQLRTLPMN